MIQAGADSKAVCILGSTGTIGVNTLDVIARHCDSLHVYALTANSNVEKLAEQCFQFNPKFAVMVQSDAAEQLYKKLRDQNSSTEVLSGEQALEITETLVRSNALDVIVVDSGSTDKTLNIVKKSITI